MRGVERPRSPCAGPAIVEILGVVALLLIVAACVPPAATDSVGHRTGLAAALAGACLGAGVAANATATLVRVGSSIPLPSVGGVSITVDYFYTQTTRLANQTNTSCVAASASGLTGTSGNASIPLPIPSNVCSPTACATYAGPYGPLRFATAGAPAGFFERDPTNGTSPATLWWDADLYRADTNVTGLRVVSADAPIAISAAAFDAVGDPVTSSLLYQWTLSGLGWELSSPSGPNVTVEGTSSGWTGTLSVTVEATFGTTTESVKSATISFVAITTELRNATASPAPVDPGRPVTFSLTGVGASGYSYVATVSPGLGVSPVTAPCTSAPLPNGTTNVSCRLSAVYPSAGTAFPTASISNGDSTSELPLAPVVVHPAEELSVAAPEWRTYPNRSLEITVNVTSGTGTAPYGPACLGTLPGPGLTCEFGNRTSFLFTVSFPVPGDYVVQVTVADGLGENVSASAVVVVVPLLTARANGSSAITLFTNQTAHLSVLVSGGALPIESWWNASTPTGTLCWGDLAFDGTIACPYPTSTLGATSLTVTLRDALGSETKVVFAVTVLAAPVPAGPSGELAPSWLGLGGLGAIGGGALIVALQIRRRRRPGGGGDSGVAESELERMAMGREHLLARAEADSPHRADELAGAWAGPPVAPEEWAEWIAALVADGSLRPERGRDGGLVYRRPLPRTPTRIEFDPTVWEARRVGSERTPPTPGEGEGRQGGG
jgi:hypothetical protein